MSEDGPRHRTARRLFVAALIMLTCAGCDQVTKGIAEEHLASSPPILLLHDLVRLEYAQNTGAFLGMGADWPREARFALFVVVAAATLVLSIIAIAKAHWIDRRSLLGLSLLAGGNIGNLIDRLQHDGAVSDFLLVGTSRLHTGVFNLADVAIMAGAGLLMLSALSPDDEPGSVDARPAT